MSEGWHVIGEAPLGNVLIVADHASNRVPPGIDLGIDRALLRTHIGWDIGVASLAHAVGAPAYLASVSRLVIDLNRDPGDPALVPLSSDGHDIPGNTDDRAARIAIPLLEAAGIVTGDQQPYSGKLLNATMNRHGEANGIPYLGLEVRQDLIDTDEGVERWAERLRPIIAEVCAQLA